jgi:hypothetical protein
VRSEFGYWNFFQVSSLSIFSELLLFGGFFGVQTLIAHGRAKAINRRPSANRKDSTLSSLGPYLNDRFLGSLSFNVSGIRLQPAPASVDAIDDTADFYGIGEFRAIGRLITEH